MSDRSQELEPEQLISIANPDEPIHRIFPLWFLEATLRLRQLVLTSPVLWEDPLEVVGHAIAVDWKEDDHLLQRIINQDLPPVYAQCWSLTSESDTLLRAYSRVVKDPHLHRNTCPRDEGVRVRSTSRKLLQSIMLGLQSTPVGICYVGSVQYFEHKQLLQEIANAVGVHGVHVFEHPRNRAKLLLMKRQAFAHEAEVRAVVVCNQSDSQDPLLRLRVDLNQLCDEITFDPRLETFERREREAVVRQLGYTGAIGESPLYTRVLLQVVLKNRPEGV